MSFQGKEFTPEMKQMVVNLKLFFDGERKAYKEVSTKKATKRTAKGLGVGEATVKRIMAEYRRQGQIIVNKSVKAKGKPGYSASINLQPVIRQYVRSKNMAGQRVGIKKLRNYLIQKHQANIPFVTLWRTLRRWGFVHGTGKRRSALKERAYVVLARRRYLREKIANRNPDGTLKRPEVYLDETYINKNHSSQFTWYLEEDGPWVNKPSGKGPRQIIVHAITKDGWVNGAELIFEAKKRTGDYHGQMNWENFSKWFSNQLLPNIPANSLIIMDNARYHNVLYEGSFPNSNSRKKQLCEWLTKNRIPWTKDMLKPELFELCKRFAPDSEFKLDKIAESAGHSILRTPQYHPELQPIETCWGVVKNDMADNCDFTMNNFRTQLPSALSKVQPETCRKIISKVVKQEEKYWTEDSQFYKFNEIDGKDEGFIESLESG
jgi:transposase